MTTSEGQDPSFDPRTWTKGETKRDLDASPASPASPLQPSRPAAGRPDARRLAAAAAIVVILTAGCLGAWLSRPAHGTGPLPSTGQAAAPANSLRRSLALASPSELDAALAGVGVPARDADAASSAALRLLGPINGELHAAFYLEPVGDAVRLERLELRRPDGSGALVVRSGDAFSATPLKAQVRIQVKDVRGEMDADDFYSSAVAAGVPDSLIHDFAQAFTFDFDFQREIKAGDIFEAVFSQGLGASGETIGDPQLLFVLLTTKARSAALYWFSPPGQTAGWFDGDGRSIVRSFMRTPVEGARISSGFGMRDHPILGFMKLHKGVDFAAPVGTPIYAAGDGVVQHAEFKDLNGNWVEILHDNGWQTLYLHLDAFAPGIAPGVRVRQGQQIGRVGVTGRSTGPHLHYEMHVNNEPVDPMTVPLQSGPVLTGQVMQAFIKERNRIDALRAQQNG